MISNELIKHKKQVIVSEKSSNEIIDFVKMKFDIEVIDIKSLKPGMYNAFTTNIFYSLENGVKKLQMDQLEFQTFRLIKNEKSDLYYSAHCNWVPVNPEDYIIYLVVEENTRCVQCNNERLFIELNLYRGVSQYDYDNETDYLHSYLNFLSFYTTKYKENR